MKLNAEGKKLLDAISEDYRTEISRTDAGKAIRLLVKQRLTDNQYSALVSLIVCIGLDTFKKSKLLKLINSSSGDWHNFVKAAEQFDFYIYSDDEEGRRKPDQFMIAHRELEKALFLMPELVRKRRV